MSEILEGKKSKIKIVIPVMARPKKNSQQIIFNSKTKRPMVIQSKLYLEFEKECKAYLKDYKLKIEYPVNLKCTFYVNTRHKRDLVNLINAVQDILVKYDVLADDNYNIVAGLDGSRVIYDKGKTETIIEIDEVK